MGRQFSKNNEPMQNQEKKLDEIIKPNAPTQFQNLLHLKIYFQMRKTMVIKKEPLRKRNSKCSQRIHFRLKKKLCSFIKMAPSKFFYAKLKNQPFFNKDWLLNQ
jgi:hypothetical protein